MPSRVIIFGNAGSGKSHLAKCMAAAWGLPTVDLDTIFWMPGGYTEKRPKELVQSQLAWKRNEPRWIIEGVYSDMISQILDRADFIVWLDIDWTTCRASLLQRGYPKSNRQDDQKMEKSFKALLAYAEAHRTRDGPISRRGHKAIFDAFEGAKRVFCSRFEVDAFSNELTKRPNKSPEPTPTAVTPRAAE